jgi:hypothetical protein
MKTCHDVMINHKNARSDGVSPERDRAPISELITKKTARTASLHRKDISIHKFNEVDRRIVIRLRARPHPPF